MRSETILTVKNKASSQRLNALSNIYLRMLTMSDANDVATPTKDIHNVVELPIAEFFDFTLFGSTYRRSFCCR